MFFYFLHIYSMKYFLSLFFVVACFLAWCHHEGELCWRWYLSNIKTWISNLWVGVYSQTTWWTLTKYFTLTWRHTMIEFSWHILIYSGMFSINLPSNLDTRSYESFAPEHNTSENLVFSEHTHTYYFSIVSSDRSLTKPSMSDKQVCLVHTEYTGVKNITRDTTTKKLAGKNIFITKVTIPNPWSHDPYLYSTHICFLDSTILYYIVMDTYHFSDVQQSIDSFNFIH